MTEKDPNEIVAVKCEGPFTEWYAPSYREPYEDDADYRQWYEENLLDVQPVFGVALGDDESAYVTEDLQCHAERMCVESGNWQMSTEEYIATVEKCLADGETRTWNDTKSDTVVRITPYRRCDLPPVNEEHIKVYGPFAGLMRKRIAEI